MEHFQAQILDPDYLWPNTRHLSQASLDRMDETRMRNSDIADEGVEQANEDDVVKCKRCGRDTVKEEYRSALYSTYLNKSGALVFYRKYYCTSCWKKYEPVDRRAKKAPVLGVA